MTTDSDDESLHIAYSAVAVGLPPVGSRAIERRMNRSDWDGAILSAYPAVDELPESIAVAAGNALSHARILPVLGAPRLREALAQIMKDSADGEAADANGILVTSGAMHALHLLWTAVGSSQRPVVIPAPAYFVEGSVRLAGLSVRAIAGGVDSDGWDWDRIDRNLASCEAAALFLSSPNNPTGASLNQHDLASLSRIAGKHRSVLIVVDESYESFLFDGVRHVGAWRLASDHKNVAIVRSFSKSYAMPWLRVGWITTTERTAELLGRIAEWESLFSSSLAHDVALAAVAEGREWLRPAYRLFEENREWMHHGLQRIPGVHAAKPVGGPFFFVSWRDQKERSELARLWKAGLPAVPGSSFLATDDAFRIPFGGARGAIDRAIVEIEQEARKEDQL